MTGIAIDTGILAFSEGLVSKAGDANRIAICQALLRRIAAAGARPIVSAQSLAETHYILTAKAKMDLVDAGIVIGRIARFATVAPVDDTVLAAASDLAAAENMPIFDAIALASAAGAGASLFISQDFPEGFAWQGMVVCDPFDPSPDSPLFAWLG